MSELFGTFEFCGMTLRNRIVRSATCENLTTPERVPSEEMISQYVQLAKGGVGLIITSATRADRSWDKREFKTWKRMSIDRDELVPSFRALVDNVHDAGSKVAMQLGSFYKLEDEFVGPSSVPYKRSASVTDKSNIAPRELTIKEIREIAKKYGMAGERIRNAGFDAVQIGGAHGFPLCNFLSPYYNQRSDEYGGNATNRTRFLREIVAEIKREAGKDYPVFIKMNISDFFEGGLTAEIAAEQAKILSENGISAFETSGGTLGHEMSQFGDVDPSKWTEGYFQDYASIIKSQVKVPVILVGGLRDPAMMMNVIKEGKADLLSMSRPFIREPEIVQRWINGDMRPSDCTNCNGCLDLLMKGDPVVCVCE
jgi:2,4-dienoyl-CoA reductase-like NADH-dependent reductase (Old Yellow Enzyme family)